MRGMLVVFFFFLTRKRLSAIKSAASFLLFAVQVRICHHLTSFHSFSKVPLKYSEPVPFIFLTQVVKGEVFMTQIEEVLMMYYDENLTDNEIAEALCIDVSTVRYILRHNS